MSLNLVIIQAVNFERKSAHKIILFRLIHNIYTHSKMEKREKGKEREKEKRQKRDCEKDKRLSERKKKKLKEKKRKNERKKKQ